ncbi:hypothetical protein ACIBQ1_56135 [Nonomuraea sp. NPDC050153]|uniref:hypothetical protein n=1 Tax=Nonomuraea sp. NPDC050153 TaxID=3364359 RepID=UPI0037AD8E83
MALTVRAGVGESVHDGHTVVDEAALGPIRLLILGDRTQHLFVPMLGDGQDAAFDRAVVEAMRSRSTLLTRLGNRIEFRGTPGPYTGTVPYDPGWSSNALTVLDLAGVRHVHKTYRRITPPSREPALLQAMNGSGMTQRPVGEYTYLPADGTRVPLGMIYVYADGDGLDVPLRQSLRSLWAALDQGSPLTPAVRSVTGPLARPISRAGAFLRRFHGELATRLGECGPFPAVGLPAAGFLASADDRIAEVAAVIRADHRYPARVRSAVVTALRAEWARAQAATHRDWPSGPGHGDLHLSHFLRAERDDGTWHMQLIDLSTPPLDPADPGFEAQSPWQDLAALLRGLACFTGDEFAYRAGLDLGVDSAESCRAALLLAAGLPPDGPGWTGTRLAHLDHLRRGAAAWQSRIGALLLRGYAPATRIAGHPAWRMFLLRRLLHELSHAYAHDRTYYAEITLRNALESGMHDD